MGDALFGTSSDFIKRKVGVAGEEYVEPALMRVCATRFPPRHLPMLRTSERNYAHQQVFGDNPGVAPYSVGLLTITRPFRKHSVGGSEK